MTWFRVDDGFDEHRKVEALAENPVEQSFALAAWTLCGAACSRRLTDGHVTPEMLAKVLLTWTPKQRSLAVSALVRVGLWDESGRGWQYRGWAERNPSKATVEERREDTRLRKAAFDERQRNKKSEQNGNALPTRPADALPSRPVPSRPSPTKETQTESAREVEASLTRNAPKPEPQAPRSVVHQIAERLCAVHHEVTGRAWTHPQELLEALDGKGALVRSGMPEQVRAIAAHVAKEPDPVAAAERALRGWAADPWVKTNRYPMAHLAKNPLKYLAKVASSSSAPSDFSHVNDSDPLPFG